MYGSTKDLEGFVSRSLLQNVAHRLKKKFQFQSRHYCFYYWVNMVIVVHLAKINKSGESISLFFPIELKFSILQYI